MITGASISTKERPSLPAKERGGPLRFHQRDRIVVAHQPVADRQPTRWTSSTAASLTRYAVLTQDVVQQATGLPIPTPATHHLNQRRHPGTAGMPGLPLHGQ